MRYRWGKLRMEFYRVSAGASTSLGVSGLAQAVTVCCARQSRHIVVAKCFEQLGHAALVSKVSNARPHRLHNQNGPSGGFALQEGQANPARRGIASSRFNVWAWL